MKVNIAVLPGDGVGPEIVAEAVKVLEAVAKRFGHDFAMTVHPVGGAAHDLCGDCLPDATLAACKVADAVLLGAVGGPKWDALPPDRRPERRALLTLRSELGLFANLRPAKVWDALKDASPLKDEIVARGIDLLIVRELTGGAYFGEKGRSDDRKAAYDVTPYSAQEIERVARAAFDAARVRRRKVTSVDKANVLETSRLWRETVSALHATEYADVELEHMYVDNAAMQRAQSGAFRRDPHGKHVWRHPIRRGFTNHGFNWHVAVGVTWRGQGRPLRTHTRFSAGHRREGDRQPAGDDPFGGDDAAPCVRTCRRGGRHRTRRGGCACIRRPHRRHSFGFRRLANGLHTRNGLCD